MPSRNEEEEGETQDPPSHPEGGAPDLSLLICARATRPDFAQVMESLTPEGLRYRAAHFMGGECRPSGAFVSSLNRPSAYPSASLRAGALG